MAKNGPEFCVLAQRQICIIETTDVSTWLQNSVFSQKRRKYLLYLFRPSSTRLVSNERQLCLLCHCCWPWRQKLATIPFNITPTYTCITKSQLKGLTHDLPLPLLQSRCWSDRRRVQTRPPTVRFLSPF